MDLSDFEALYRASAGALRLYVVRVCGDRHLAEDIVQETYLRFLRALATGTEPEQCRVYLFQIASNALKDHWRQARRSWRAGGELDIAGEHPHRPAAPSEARRVAALDLRSALARLRPRDRQILWLAYAEGYSHLEIAGILGLRPASVRVLLFRTRHRVSRELRSAEGRSGGGK